MTPANFSIRRCTIWCAACDWTANYTGYGADLPDVLRTLPFGERYDVERGICPACGCSHLEKTVQDRERRPITISARQRKTFWLTLPEELLGEVVR